MLRRFAALEDAPFKVFEGWGTTHCMSTPHCIVTGAAGFVGSQLAHSLSQSGWTVDAWDDPTLFAERPHLPKTPFRHVTDYRSFDFSGSSGRWHGDAIFHMGACTDTTELDETFLNKVNTEFSQSLWKMAVAQKVPFFYASSAATYGAGARGYQDDLEGLDSLQPLNPYGASKHRFDLWVRDQIRAGTTPPRWAGFKFFNVYGKGEDHKGAMASFVSQALLQIRRTDEVRLFKSLRPGIADGEQARDFIAVEDVVHVLKHFAETPCRNSIYNLGTGRARSYNALVRGVFDALRKPPRISYFDPPPSIESRYQYFTEAPMAKLQAEMPRGGLDFLTLEKGIQLTVGALF